MTNSIPLIQSTRWQDELSDLIRDPITLLKMLDLDTRVDPETLAACEQFPVKVPRPFAKKMRKGDPNDPLLLQVLPTNQESVLSPGYTRDPLSEIEQNPYPGLIHKYESRVLLVVSGSCGIHCRYCFRRHFPYQDNNPNRNHWKKVLDYIADTPSINEVIYSGGDPLSASDNQLAWLTNQIGQIEHIKRLRIHTRLPVMLPSRIDSKLLHWLEATNLQKVLVLHCNHPNELDDETAAMVHRLKQANVTVLNQSVLLNNINNNAETLSQLSEQLFDKGILPYYLHLPDKVEGTRHFDISEQEAIALHRQLLKKLPGFLVPKLVKESPGATSKTPLL